MATYLLIHGGFSGGWVWHEVANHLRRAGHEVFTPTLTDHSPHRTMPAALTSLLLELAEQS